MSNDVFGETATQDLLKRAIGWPDIALEIRVTSDVSYAEAGELALAIEDLHNELDAPFDSMMAKAHHSPKTALERKQRGEAKLVEAETILITALADY